MLTRVLVALLSAAILDVSRAQQSAPAPSSEAAPLLAPTSAFQALAAPSNSLASDVLASEYLGGVYQVPLTNITLPGTQTRTEIMAVFPGRYFEGPTGRRRLAQAPVKGLGGWTLYSLDAGVTVTHAVPIPNGQIFAFERSGNREPNPLLASVYNLNTNTYRQFALQDSAFCGGHIMLKTGEVLIAGGDQSYAQPAIGFKDGRFAVRIFTPGANPAIRQVATMKPGPHYPNYPAKIDGNSGGRWYPSMLTLQDGRVLIVGGVVRSAANFFATNPTGQVFNPIGNVLQDPWPMPILQDPKNPFNLYPFTALLPNGLVMVIAGRLTQFYSVAASGQITQVTNYKAVPALPLQVCYPQTASIHILPYAPPAYAPKVLVIGGAGVEGANPQTPASPYVYVLDLSLANPVWVRDTMPSARIMPDGVLLPDGTVGIFNGAEVGIAGGTPGKGMARSPGATTQKAVIYNPAAPAGQKFSGLLASSQRERYYHSQAWLTQNAEVLTAGSEPTEDYTIQIFTPPYLTGAFNRPLIANPSNLSPGYNALFTVTLTWAPNNNRGENIARVVFNLANGITHSTHFDERQVIATFTQTAVQLTIRTPPNANIAPPGNYLVFAVSSSGRPSQGVYIGLGGARPAPKYFEPANRAVLPDGAYTIQSTAGALAGCRYFSVPPCSGSTEGLVAGAVDTWELKVVKTAPDLNTYNIFNPKRNACQNLFAGRGCGTPADTVVGVYTFDDRSGRQRFTLIPAPGGGFYIKMNYGRNACQAATYVTVPGGTCAKPALLNAPLGAGPQIWNFVPVGAAPGPLANGLYTIASAGRTACAPQLSLPPCGPANDAFMGTSGVYQLNYNLGTNTYTVFNQARTTCKGVLSGYRCGASNNVFGYTGDDGSGRQRLRFNPVAGGYNIVLPAGREACTQPNFVTAQTCASGNNAVTFAAAGGGLQVWTVTPYRGTAARVATPVLLASPVPPQLENGIYSIALTSRTECDPYLNIGYCGAGNQPALATASNWLLTLLPSAPNRYTYQVQSQTRSGYCADLLSAYTCANGSDITTAKKDDASGRQQFQFIPTAGGYSIVLPNGRPGCSDTYVTGATCKQGSGVWLKAQGIGPQIWNVTPVMTTTQAVTQANVAPEVKTKYTPPFPSGYYQIASVARKPCMLTRFLTSAGCGNGDGVGLGNTAAYYLSYSTGGSFPGTYTIINTGRTGSCSNILTASFCNNDTLSHAAEESEAGLTRFTFEQHADGTYTIKAAVQGRPSCKRVLGSAPCGTFGVSFTSTDTGNGLERWNVTAYTPPRLVADGQYQVYSNARSTCPDQKFLLAPQCTNGSSLSLDSGGVFDLSYMTNAQYPNTYLLKVPDRTTCGNIVSGNTCEKGNSIGTYLKDDGSGRQQFRFTPVAGGYQIDLPNGRTGCSSLLSASACSSDSLSFASAAKGAAATWSLLSQAPDSAPPVRLLANGDYHISNTADTKCTSMLSGASCTAGDAMGLAAADNGTGQVWTLSYVTNAETANTYTVKCKYRTACDSYMSAPGCTATVPDYAPRDTGSGTERWQISMSGLSAYSIRVVQGRSSCTAASFLSTAGCKAQPNYVMLGHNTTAAVWNVVPVNPAAG